MDLRPATERDLRFVFAVAVAGALAAVAYLPNLSVDTLLIDERIYLEAGQQYLDGDFSANREHPPLAKLAFGLAGRLIGDPVVGGRLVSVAAGGAIAVAVFVLLRRMAGRWWGLAGAVLWVVTPHALRFPVLPWGGFDRLDRYAMLDPASTALALWAVVAAVRWSDDHRLRWGVGAGVLVGLAMGAKVSGVLVLPAVAAVPWIAAWPTRRSWGWWVRWCAPRSLLVAAVAGLTFALTYLPLGAEAFETFGFMVDFQGNHAARGHAVVVAGQAYPSAPWWAQAWYAWRDEGGLVVIALVVAAGVGVAAGPGRWRHRGLVLASVVVPVGVFAVSPVLLPHYRFLWLPGLVVLATLGLAALVTRSGTMAPRMLAVLLVAALVGTGAASIASITTRGVWGYAAAAERLQERDLPAPAVLVEGFPGLLLYYLPDAEVVDRVAEAEVVVLDPTRTDLRPVPELLDHLERGGWVLVEVDALEVWLRP